MTVYEVTFSAGAIADVAEAVNYYNSKQADLGRKFARQLEKTLNSVRLNPYYVSLRYQGIRCAKIKAFPFLIHYNVTEHQRLVKVLAVYSTYKKPLW